MLGQDDSNSGLGGIRLGIHTEQRRQAHLSAEQKRRCNLKVFNLFKVENVFYLFIYLFLICYSFSFFFLMIVII
jgi:hypothetical protein